MHLQRQSIHDALYWLTHLKGHDDVRESDLMLNSSHTSAEAAVCSMSSSCDTWATINQIMQWRHANVQFVPTRNGVICVGCHDGVMCMRMRVFHLLGSKYVGNVLFDGGVTVRVDDNSFLPAAQQPFRDNWRQFLCTGSVAIEDLSSTEQWGNDTSPQQAHIQVHEHTLCLFGCCSGFWRSAWWYRRRWELGPSLRTLSSGCAETLCASPAVWRTSSECWPWYRTEAEEKGQLCERKRTRAYRAASKIYRTVPLINPTYIFGSSCIKYNY